MRWATVIGQCALLVGRPYGTKRETASTHPPRLLRFSPRGLFAAAAFLAFTVVPGQPKAAASMPVVVTANPGTFVVAETALAIPRARANTADELTEDFSVTPLVSPAVREFVTSDDDSDRASLLGRIVVPLLLLLLVERELLALGGRSERDAFRTYTLPLIACFAILVLAKLRGYME
jgi:hypothetical protein